MAAITTTPRCWLCVVRVDGNNPLAAKDETAAGAWTGRKRRGVDHDALAPNCIENEDWRRRCPRCSTCDRLGDTCTARFARGEDKKNDARCGRCRHEEGLAARDAQLAERRSVEDARRVVFESHGAQNRPKKEDREDWNTVGDDGLNTYQRLGDAAHDPCHGPELLLQHFTSMLQVALHVLPACGSAPHAVQQVNFFLIVRIARNKILLEVALLLLPQLLVELHDREVFYIFPGHDPGRLDVREGVVVLRDLLVGLEVACAR